MSRKAADLIESPHVALRIAAQSEISMSKCARELRLKESDSFSILSWAHRGRTARLNDLDAGVNHRYADVQIRQSSVLFEAPYPMRDLGEAIDKICARRAERQGRATDLPPRVLLSPVGPGWLERCLVYPTAPSLSVLAVVGYLGIALFVAMEGLRSAPPVLRAAPLTAIPPAGPVGPARAGLTPAPAVSTSGSLVTPPRGTLCGRISYSGQPPTRKTLVSHTGGHPVLDESLIVDESTSGLANAVVCLDALPTHITVPPPTTTEVRINRIGSRFIPHVVPVRTGQFVIVTNNDERAVNVLPTTMVNVSVSQGIRPGASALMTFPAAERDPLPLRTLDPSRPAYLVILDHPWVAVTDRNGSFTITDLPVGNHSFNVWHEKTGRWSPLFKVEIRDGDTTGVEISAPAASFGR